MGEEGRSGTQDRGETNLKGGEKKSGEGLTSSWRERGPRSMIHGKREIFSAMCTGELL